MYQRTNNTFKGQLSAKVFMQNKPTRWGVKNFMLCWESGLVYDFLLYQGSTTEINLKYSAFSKTESLVMHLCERINVEKINLFFDNISLFEWLKNKKIFAVSTVRSNRFVCPPFLSDKKIRKDHG